MNRVPQARKNSSQYVAFLRGINVGGHASIKMVDLKAAFEKLGFYGVRTVLASGNVIFESKDKEPILLAKEIEAGLKKTFGKEIDVAVRGLNVLKKLRLSEPFKEIEMTPSMRFYVTFLSGKARPRTIAIPYSTPEGEFRILQVTFGEVFSVVDLAKGKGTPEALLVLEKIFGKNITTRNWNTVLKIFTGFPGMDSVSS